MVLSYGGPHMLKSLKNILIIILLLIVAYYIGLGLLPRSDVWISHFQVSEQQDTITIYTTDSSSAGYTRTVKNVSNDPKMMKLKFYSAFGGVNGSIGAKSEFDLPLSPECKEIYVLLDADYELSIKKNPITGKWEYA